MVPEPPPAHYGGLYRARCVKVEADLVFAQIPQLYGDVTVAFGSSVGVLPQANDLGWVAFEGGHEARPIWVSGRSDTASAVVLTSPNGTKYLLAVNDAGVLSTTAI